MTRRLLTTLLPLLLGSLLPSHVEPEDAWVLGVKELHRVDLLPRFKPSVYVGSVSSYDRTGGNDDGFGVGITASTWTR